MTQKPSAISTWAGIGFVLIFFFAGIKALDTMQAVSQADAEALAFDTMQSAHLPVADLCKQAGRAHRAYAALGADMQTRQWASIEQSSCDRAAICATIIGGCSQ